MTPKQQDIQARERDLVVRAMEGDDRAFEAIVNIYSARMVDYCRRMVGPHGPAEDLAQETFVKFYLALPRFDPRRRIGPLLYRIAHNHCTDFLRKKYVPTISLTREDRQGAETAQVDHPGDDPDPEQLALRTEVQDAVQAALDGLPDAYRSAMILYHREGLSYEEISRTLEIPMGTVKARIHRGREKLQQSLADLVVT